MKYNSEWYKKLKKPNYTPNHTVFKKVWTILYLMMFFALLLIIFNKENSMKNIDYLLFSLQLVINFYWPICFFEEKNLYKSFLISIVLLVFVGMTMSSFYLTTKLAGILFLPYFLWCSFATILNYQIFKLNNK